MSDDRRHDVILTDGTTVEHYRRVDYLTRNRLADFAFRHDLRLSVRESEARPERRSYR